MRRLCNDFGREICWIALEVLDTLLYQPTIIKRIAIFYGRYVVGALVLEIQRHIPLHAELLIQPAM